MPHPATAPRWLLAALLLLPACRSTPEPPPLSEDSALNAFARQVQGDLEAHAWGDLIAAAQESHYRTQVVEHGMSEPQYVAELFGLHRVGNSIERGEEIRWADLERIEAVELTSLSRSGGAATLEGRVRLRDGTTLELRSRVTREEGRYVLTGGVG